MSVCVRVRVCVCVCVCNLRNEIHALINEIHAFMNNYSQLTPSRAIIAKVYTRHNERPHENSP